MSEPGAGEGGVGAQLWSQSPGDAVLRRLHGGCFTCKAEIERLRSQGRGNRMPGWQHPEVGKSPKGAFLEKDGVGVTGQGTSACKEGHWHLWNQGIAAAPSSFQYSNYFQALPTD